MKVFNNQGQTLVEVVLALAVASLVLLALTRVVTISLKSAQFSKNQTLATHHAQETMEVIRAYRDQNSWTDFSIKANCESPTGLPGLTTGFNRDIDCTIAGDKVTVIVTVSWDEGAHETKLTSYFTQWQ